MTGPTWLAGSFAVLMLLVAVCCAARLALWRLRRYQTEPDADAVHVLMGVAMAGMFEPRLGLIPGIAWLPLFAIAVAWFSGQAVRRAHTRGKPGDVWCALPVPHAVECAVMLYMFLPGGPMSRVPAAAMPGMNGNGVTAAANLALVAALALLMLGYMLWTTHRPTALPRARTADVSGSAFAASYKIAMSIGMGYMLITML